MLKILEFRARTPRWVIVVLDLFISLFALTLAYLIRFDLKADANTIENEWNVLSKSLFLFFALKFIVFYLFKKRFHILFYSLSTLFNLFRWYYLIPFLVYAFKIYLNSFTHFSFCLLNNLIANNIFS